jgi:uncharacterized repeat protein (TIGR03803 family)
MRTWSSVSRVLLVLAVVLAPAVMAGATLSILHTFTGADGANPYSGLVRDSAGNLYGTTYFGGAFGNGVVFKLDTTGKLTVLHSFAGGPTDGQYPWAGLIRDADGNLYGTTKLGGKSGNGVVFKLDSSDNETVLHSFTGGPGDGSTPYAGLFRDAAGNLYGTTYYGGRSGNGVVFKLQTNGKHTVLHSFTGGSDGGTPGAALVQDTAGNLYGTTTVGGASGKGVVFKLDTTNKFTVLHSFAGYPSDGAGPFAGLILDAAGNLYGATETGGASNDGVVFKVDTTGTETVLHNFGGIPADGAVPFAGLFQNAAGNFFGTTYNGGSTGCLIGCGVVFKLDTTGKLTVLHNFTGGTDGATPAGALVRDAAGNLYGTTAQGGGSGLGVVFKVTP